MSWQGKISIKVIKGEGLLGVDRGNTSDPFIVVYLEQGKKLIAELKSKIVKKTLNPEWNQVLSADVSKAAAGPITLRLECWDDNSIKKSVFIGTIIKTIELNYNFGELETHPLQPRSTHKKDLTKGIKGTITFSVFYETAGNMTQQLNKSFNELQLESSLPRSFGDNCKVVGSIAGKGTLAEIEHFKLVRSFMDLSCYKLEIPLKRVRVSLENSSIWVNTGQLHYMNGDLKLDSSFAILEDPKTQIKGTGVVYLESSYKCYFPILVSGSAYVDRGMWATADGNLKISKSMIPGAAGLIGGEGLYQTKFEGEGWVIVACPYPPEEIQVINLQNDKLTVDGHYSIFRTGAVSYTIECAGKGLLQKGLDTTGEGKMNVFKGTGLVLLCCTEGYYPKPPMPPNVERQVGEEVGGEAAGEAAGMAVEGGLSLLGSLL